MLRDSGDGGDEEEVSYYEGGGGDSSCTIKQCQRGEVDSFDAVFYLLDLIHLFDLLRDRERVRARYMRDFVKIETKIVGVCK